MNTPDKIEGVITQEDLDKANAALFPGGEKVDDYKEKAQCNCPIWQMLTRMGYTDVAVYHSSLIEIGGAVYCDAVPGFIPAYDESDQNDPPPLIGAKIVLECLTAPAT